MAGLQTDGQCLLRIDKEGNWFYNKLPIINKAIYLFFNQHLTQDESGAYIIRIGNETSRLFVEDTPFVVTGVDYIQTKAPEDYFDIRLNDETIEKLDLQTLYIGKNNIPYCRVKGGTFPARFLRSAYYQLSQHVQQEGEEGFYIMLNGRKQHLYLPS
jgi:hypothetical protein